MEGAFSGLARAGGATNAAVARATKVRDSEIRDRQT
jgi:hypothetical protein